MADTITIRGAEEHNLRNISLTLPRERLIVFTGLSGSGKSSLAFDTIYAEGQRRYVESLSAYARQFLGQMDKPDVDFIEGLSPAISIDQKSASRNPRSTVGTITEVYDYLRLLYARVGVAALPRDGEELTRQTPQQIVDRLLELPEGTRFQVLAPVVRGRKGTYEQLFTDFATQGFARARVDGEVHELRDQDRARSLRAAHDRGRRRPAGAPRGHRAAAHRLDGDGARAGRGVAEVAARPEGRRGRRRDADVLRSTWPARPTARAYEELAPRNFSFNSPYGACPECDGLGIGVEVDPELVVPDPELSVADGAIAPWAGGRTPSTSTACSSRCARRTGIADERALVGSSPRSSRSCCCTAWVHGAGRGPVPQPLRPHPQLRGQVRGRRSRTCSDATPRPRATLPASRSRATCARCRAPNAAGARLKPTVAGGDRSTAATSSRSAAMSIRRRGRDGPRGLELTERQSA